MTIVTGLPVFEKLSKYSVRILMFTSYRYSLRLILCIVHEWGKALPPLTKFKRCKKWASCRKCGSRWRNWRLKGDNWSILQFTFRHMLIGKERKIYGMKAEGRRLENAMRGEIFLFRVELRAFKEPQWIKRQRQWISI